MLYNQYSSNSNNQQPRPTFNSIGNIQDLAIYDLLKRGLLIEELIKKSEGYTKEGKEAANNQIQKEKENLENEILKHDIDELEKYFDKQEQSIRLSLSRSQSIGHDESQLLDSNVFDIVRNSISNAKRRSTSSIGANSINFGFSGNKVSGVNTENKKESYHTPIRGINGSEYKNYNQQNEFLQRRDSEWHEPENNLSNSKVQIRYQSPEGRESHNELNQYLNHSNSMNESNVNRGLLNESERLLNESRRYNLENSLGNSRNFKEGYKSGRNLSEEVDRKIIADSRRNYNYEPLETEKRVTFDASEAKHIVGRNSNERGTIYSGDQRISSQSNTPQVPQYQTYIHHSSLTVDPLNQGYQATSVGAKPLDVAELNSSSLNRNRKKFFNNEGRKSLNIATLQVNENQEDKQRTQSFPQNNNIKSVPTPRFNSANSSYNTFINKGLDDKSKKISDGKIIIESVKNFESFSKDGVKKTDSRIIINEAENEDLLLLLKLKQIEILYRNSLKLQDDVYSENLKDNIQKTINFLNKVISNKNISVNKKNEVEKSIALILKAKDDVNQVIYQRKEKNNKEKKSEDNKELENILNDINNSIPSDSFYVISNIIEEVRSQKQINQDEINKILAYNNNVNERKEGRFFGEDNIELKFERTFGLKKLPEKLIEYNTRLKVLEEVKEMDLISDNFYSNEGDFLKNFTNGGRKDADVWLSKEYEYIVNFVYNRIGDEKIASEDYSFYFLLKNKKDKNEEERHALNQLGKYLLNKNIEIDTNKVDAPFLIKILLKEEESKNTDLDIILFNQLAGLVDYLGSDPFIFNTFLEIKKENSNFKTINALEFIKNYLEKNENVDIENLNNNLRYEFIESYKNEINHNVLLNSLNEIKKINEEIKNLKENPSEDQEKRFLEIDKKIKFIFEKTKEFKTSDENSKEEIKNLKGEIDKLQENLKDKNLAKYFDKIKDKQIKDVVKKSNKILKKFQEEIKKQLPDVENLAKIEKENLTRLETKLEEHKKEHQNKLDAFNKQNQNEHSSDQNSELLIGGLSLVVGAVISIVFAANAIALAFGLAFVGAGVFAGLHIAGKKFFSKPDEEVKANSVSTKRDLISLNSPEILNLKDISNQKNIEEIVVNKEEKPKLKNLNNINKENKAEI